MDVIAVAALFPDLTTVEIIQWVEQGWVVPDTADAGLVFHEIDVARVRLIHDLRRDMEIGEDAIPLVLSLLDQVYESAQPDERHPARALLAVRGCAGRRTRRSAAGCSPAMTARATLHGLAVCGVRAIWSGVSWKPARMV